MTDGTSRRTNSRRFRFVSSPIPRLMSASDLVWLEFPDGTVSIDDASSLGRQVAHSRILVAPNRPNDPTLGDYVLPARSTEEARLAVQTWWNTPNLCDSEPHELFSILESAIGHARRCGAESIVALRVYGLLARLRCSLPVGTIPTPERGAVRSRTRVSVSGSFRTSLVAVTEAVDAFSGLGCEVLSPQDPTIVERAGPSVFLASDEWRIMRMVEDKHLAAIAQSSFLWVACTDGYIGPSTAFEIGYARALGVPVYSSVSADNALMRGLLRKVRGYRDAVFNRPHSSVPPSTGLDFLANPARFLSAMERVLRAGLIVRPRSIIKPAAGLKRGEDSPVSLAHLTPLQERGI